MKTKLTTVLALILLTACKTMDVAQIAPACQEAAAIGTEAALLYKPEWRPAFGVARDSLKALGGSTNILTLPALLDILNKLPISELSSDTARLSFSGAKLLIAMFGYSNIEPVKSDQLKLLANALADGINEGMGKTTATSKLFKLKKKPSSYFKVRE